MLNPYSDLPNTYYEIGPRQWTWILALESGDYKQGEGGLRIHDRYCCLGLMCEVMQADYDPDWGALTPALAGLIGLRSTWGCPVEFTGQYQPDCPDALANLNDTGSTFEEIAAILRKHPNRYFKEKK